MDEETDPADEERVPEVRGCGVVQEWFTNGKGSEDSESPSPMREC
jgi:hypothetical protein